KPERGSLARGGARGAIARCCAARAAGAGPRFRRRDAAGGFAGAGSLPDRDSFGGSPDSQTPRAATDDREAWQAPGRGGARARLGARRVFSGEVFASESRTRARSPGAGSTRRGGQIRAIAAL